MSEATNNRILVREGTPGDIEPMALSMARAFLDDPLISWVMPDEATRLDVQRRLYRTMFRDLVRTRYGELLTTHDTVGAAIWMRPGKPKPPASSTARLVATMVRNARQVKIARYAAAMQAIEKRHPRQPHWYLSGIGTDPDFQRQGVATALMRPILDRCDAEGVGAYLETQKERNVPIYEHKGFRVVDELDLPKGGPHLWLMWREPA